MVHVATVHFRSPRWIEIQVTHLRRHIPAPLTIWGSVQGIDARDAAHFDRAIEHIGNATHPEKLNHLALEISNEAADEDLLMFLDGDAFPIADLGSLLASALSEAPLLAVRRVEQANEPHPHPCFCVTTVGFWRRLPGDWSRGYSWIDGNGVAASGVGANLLRALEITDSPWLELHRSNANEAHPALFGVYGGVATTTVARFATPWSSGPTATLHRRLWPCRRCRVWMRWCAFSTAAGTGVGSSRSRTPTRSFRRSYTKGSPTAIPTGSRASAVRASPRPRFVSRPCRSSKRRAGRDSDNR